MKNILITGAAGTIGSALTIELLAQGHKVRALDCSEDGLFNLQKRINQEYIANFRPLLGDIRDEARLKFVFRGIDHVYHTAALKHVDISEYNPLECIKTNVIAIQHVIHAAIEANVDKVLFTSSDKAINPIGVMGASKLIGERIFLNSNSIVGDSRTKFSAVRFGNVLGSNGSVLKVFDRCKLNQRPYPITDKKMSRFFITLKESVDLCTSAMDMMEGGEIYVKEMIHSSIINLAKAHFGSDDLQFEYIGVKTGEKLYEEIMSSDEAERVLIKDGIYCIVSLRNSETLISSKSADGWTKVLPRIKTDTDSGLNVKQLHEYLSFNELI